jgi:hypothetical protein
MFYGLHFLRKCTHSLSCMDFLMLRQEQSLENIDNVHIGLFEIDKCAALSRHLQDAGTFTFNIRMSCSSSSLR